MQATVERVIGKMNDYTSRFRGLATATAIASLFSYAAVLLVTQAANNEIKAFYGVSLSQLSWLPLATMCGFFVAALSAGAYADRHGKLRAVLSGCFAMCLGAAIFAITTDFRVAVLALLVMGIGGGLSECTSMALVSDLYQDSRRTIMMNVSQAAFGVGAVASPFLMNRLIAAGINWRWGYVIIAASCAASAIVAFAALVMRHERPIGLHVGANWRANLSDTFVLCLSVGIMLYVGSELGQSNWMSVYFKDDLHASRALAAASPSLLWIGITLGRASIAWVSNRLSDIAIVRWSLALAGVSQIALLLSHGPTEALIAAFCLGVFVGPVFPTITSIAGAAYPEKSGAVLGIIVASGSLGAAIFTPAIGVAGDQLGIRGALWTCFALLAVNVALFTMLRGRFSTRSIT